MIWTRFCRPLKGLGNFWERVPGGSRFALTPGYLLSRLRVKERGGRQKEAGVTLDQSNQS